MVEQDPVDLANLYKPASLRYYTGICRGDNYSVPLTTEECAAVLKAYDYGLWGLQEEEIVLVNSVISKLKDRIHP
ncbi:MAG: hypothetical protein NVV73_07120 [Cellvibrionaceae bacterium]|nr:hypothetical protein [Cellvibrionaceae bacterium]